METRKTNLTIEDFEDKKFGEGKNAGRYTRFKTDQGWISSFDKPTIEKLKDNEGKCIEVEIATDKNDKEKIMKFIGMADDDGVLYVPAERVEEKKPARETKNPTSMYVSYAKDLFIAIMNRATNPIDSDATMELSITLVKKAQKAFE
jgi:transposase